jgi:transposase
MLNRQRTQLSNSMRAHMSEFSVVAPVGRMGLDRLLAVVANPDDLRIPADARICLEMLAPQLVVVKKQILENDRRIREAPAASCASHRARRPPASGRCTASPTCAPSWSSAAAWKAR